MKSSTENLIRDVHDEVICWRRHIHANPDLSFPEKRLQILSPVNWRICRS